MNLLLEQLLARPVGLSLSTNAAPRPSYVVYLRVCRVSSPGSSARDNYWRFETQRKAPQVLKLGGLSHGSSLPKWGAISPDGPPPGPYLLFLPNPPKSSLGWSNRFRPVGFQVSSAFVAPPELAVPWAWPLWAETLPSPPNEAEASLCPMRKETRYASRSPPFQICSSHPPESQATWYEMRRMRFQERRTSRLW